MKISYPLGREMPEVLEDEMEYKECVHLPVPGGAVKKAEVGEKVRAVITGKVKHLSAGEGYASLEIELDEVQLGVGKTEYEEMAEEDA